jgi:DNA-directed RNA polymerase subunit beta'
LIPAGTGLAYHDARKRAAIAALTPSVAAPSEAAAAAEALFADLDPKALAGTVEAAVTEVPVVETPAE